MSFPKKIWSLGLVLLLCLLLCTCSSFRSGSLVDEAPFSLVVVPEKSHYRVGEAVICKAYLHNISDKTYSLCSLNAKSVSFWVRHEGGGGINIQPVHSEQEDLLAPLELGKYETTSRTFLLTRATTTTGTFMLQGVYDSSPELSYEHHFVVPSPAVVMKVSYPVRFTRDAEGIVLKEEAIRIAREEIEDPQAKVVDIALVKNEAGFLDWWVILSLSSQSGTKEVKRAFLVNPYLGVVRQEVDPERVPPKREPPDVQVRVRK